LSEYFSIGKLAATFGVKGEMILKHHLGKKTALKGVEALFVEVNRDELLPYFIQSCRIKDHDELFIQLEGVDTKDKAQKLLQKQVWLTEEEFHKHTAKSAPLSLLGFHIIDKGEDIGEILEVIEQPHQLLCRIDWKGKEALIPIHEEFTRKVDKKNRKILVDLPEGLLDIFL